MYVAKTKALISYTVTDQLICAFVFAYTKTRFSRDAAQLEQGVQYFSDLFFFNFVLLFCFS